MYALNILINNRDIYIKIKQKYKKRVKFKPENDFSSDLQSNYP